MPLTSLVGRTRELEWISETLRGARLVTLTGPGGVGKTRLALEVARRQVPRRGDGVWLVDLASSPERPDVAVETARILDVRSPAGTRAVDALRRYLARRDVLIVLDNCEHVVDTCAELAGALLSSCENARIMATSREVLAVNGETVCRLDPLKIEDAHRLFMERARQRQPEFISSEETGATIAQLCTRLDRLPLAIELAAARISVLSPAEILADLETRLGELGGAGRLSPPRHRSVRAAVEWSYQLLDPDEQQAFRSLAVFVGGFDTDAAMSVTQGASFDLIARLVDKSLVAAARSPGGRTRYRLLETARGYAGELLVDAHELEAARERHLRYFLALADVAREEWPAATRQPAVAQRLEHEVDDYKNVRAALEWNAASDPCSALRLLAGARSLFFSFGQADGLRLALLLLAQCPARDRHRVEAQIAAAQLAIMVADSQAARSLLTEARALSAELGERALEGWTRFFQGLIETLEGEIEPGREHLEAGRTLHRELRIRIGEARSTAVLGMTFLMAKETGRAKELVEEALSMYITENDMWGQGQCHTYLGFIAESDAADLRGATSHYRRAVDLLRPFGDATLLPVALIGQASVLARRDPRGALKVAAAASAIRERIGGKLPPFYAERLERVRALGEAALGGDADAVWAQGVRLDADDAISVAFGSKMPPRPDPPSGLSPREVEVARLVAEGRSNKEIAARLHLSVRTVESHVHHALDELGLVNRTQLAAWARDRTQ